jgi:tetratricopeptide (TPR) repeat protein
VASVPAAPITGTPPAATSAADTQEAPSPPPEPARNERRAAPQAEPEGPVRISRGELKVQPALLRAVELLETDDLAGATRAYEQVLRGDARNSDALLGMAAIAIRQNDLRSAEGWYLRALEADPKDINAQAGLINLRGQADPQAAESRIKGLLASQPDSPTLNFALGNLYAGQRRWPEAQLAYFNAHTADPTHPDYLFNLATSLDHMHLPKVALDYYKSALAASGSRRPSFNPDQVKARILELQP